MAIVAYLPETLTIGVYVRTRNYKPSYVGNITREEWETQGGE